MPQDSMKTQAAKGVFFLAILRMMIDPHRGSGLNFTISHFKSHIKFSELVAPIRVVGFQNPIIHL